MNRKYDEKYSKALINIQTLASNISNLKSDLAYFKIEDNGYNLEKFEEECK